VDPDSLNPDPDPAFQVYISGSGPNPDPGFYDLKDQKLKKKIQMKNFFDQNLQFTFV
jgi:hypothetical protein